MSPMVLLIAILDLTPGISSDCSRDKDQCVIVNTMPIVFSHSTINFRAASHVTVMSKCLE